METLVMNTINEYLAKKLITTLQFEYLMTNLVGICEKVKQMAGDNALPVCIEYVVEQYV